jgi:hypothetical protein
MLPQPLPYLKTASLLRQMNYQDSQNRQPALEEDPGMQASFSNKNLRVSQDGSRNWVCPKCNTRQDMLNKECQECKKNSTCEKCGRPKENCQGFT